MLSFLDNLNHQDDLLQTTINQTESIGWALAVSLCFALISFIFSRFIAGMSKVQVWANLRGGSACMVGNAFVLLALSIGLLFRFFDNEQVLIAVCWFIPILALAVAAETVVNFVLNMYRPRIQGESPRPAFDSKTLSMFASPDSLVRSINEAINYQFGFDITSSWGYQLLLRSIAWLFGLAIVVLFAMSAMVIVEPTEQAFRLRQGALVGEVYDPGIMFKFPWPIEKSVIVDVTRVRELPLTFRWKEQRSVILWAEDYQKYTVTKPRPFIVNDSKGNSESISDDLLSLVDIRAILRYRIAKDGLLDWLSLGSSDVDRRSRLSQREMSLLAISQGAITNLFQGLQLDDVLGNERGDLSLIATAKVQEALDAQSSGVEVVSVDLPLISPTGDAAESFEELSVAKQGEERLISAATGHAQALMTRTVGDPEEVDRVLDSVLSYNQVRDRWDELRRDNSASDDDVKNAFQEMKNKEALAIAAINKGNGRAASIIRDSRVDRWTTLMRTWSSASRVNGQMKAFEAAPQLYMQRMYMSVLARKLPSMRKYLIGIAPDRLSLDLELRSINPLLNFADAIDSSEEGGQ
jgi:regulator of protease activity HflC (stomatin/prohibitin superfamily)